jgi:hypothetical protein
MGLPNKEEYFEDIMKEKLACECCGWIETPPFVEGDTCICGGVFHKYEGETVFIGNVEFAKTKEV